MRYLGMLQLILLFFLLINGCGSSALQNAKSTVVGLGTAWIEIDKRFAPAYEKARIDVRETSQNWEERDEKLEGWEKARSAITSAGLALKSAALAVSMAEQSASANWILLTTEAIEAMQAAIESMEKLDLKIPPTIKKTINTAKLLISGQ